MFVVRTICIENSFFSTYRHYSEDNIDPLIPEEYRLVLYLLPCLVSFLINMTKLAMSIKPKDFRYFKRFPQFLLCPMFSPLMFEGDPDQTDDNQPPVRVWKLGSILNSFFIGCIPQVMLIAFDHYRKVPDWDFEDEVQDNNALLKSPTANIIFSIATLALYLCITIIFFSWNILFQDNGLLCTLCKTICRPFPNPCSHPIPEESESSTVNKEENQERDDELSSNPTPEESDPSTVNNEDKQARDDELSTNSKPDELDTTPVNNEENLEKDEELSTNDLTSENQNEETARDEGHIEVSFLFH